MLWRIIATGVLIVVVVAGIGIYLAPDDLVDCKGVETTGECRKADAIVVISGGDTTARTDEAIRLFQEGWAEYIVFSGAAADKDGPSNAVAMKEHALENGVPESQTIIEERSETTKQNAKEVREQLENLEIRDIILVTSGYHMRRAGLEFSRELTNEFTVRRHPVAHDKQWSSVWWLTPWGWWLVLGELAKIGLFYIGGSR